MKRFGARWIALVITIAALLPAAQASSQEESALNRRTVGHDPAVVAFTTFVGGRDLDYPADRAVIVAALDRLACAIEGLGLTRNDFSDADLSSVHKLRRDIRRLASSADTQALTNARADTFATVALLLRHLDNVTLGGAETSLLDALDRSARGLDRTYPLKWQPVAMQNFFRYASKALKQIDHR
jgi:hypothetical protein